MFRMVLTSHRTFQKLSEEYELTSLLLRDIGYGNHLKFFLGSRDDRYCQSSSFISMGMRNLVAAMLHVWRFLEY